VAITRGGYRFTIDTDTGRGSLWKLDPTGQRDAYVEDLTIRNTVGRALFDELRALRGDLQPISVDDSGPELSAENLKKLRSLGYIE
jgi:hypothetical protein